MSEMDLQQGAVETAEVAPEIAGGYAAMSPEQRELAKTKQVESMKAKWQDPVYKAKVSLGRHTKAVEKLNAEIAEIEANLVGATEEDAVKLNAEKVKLSSKLTETLTKVSEAQAELDAVKPVVNVEQ